MEWKTELMDDVEDQALDNPDYALADRKWFLDSTIHPFLNEKPRSALQPSAHPQDFSQFTTDEKFTLLNVSWKIAHSQRQKARNLQRKLDNTCKELGRQQKQTTDCVKLFRSLVHKRAAKSAVRKSRQENGRSRIDCPICHHTEVNVVTGCGHAFCKECIDHWELIGNSCPTCRKPLEGPHPLHI